MKDYLVVRSVRKKNVTITVKPDGVVQVTAPPGVSLGQIQELVEQRVTWIQKCLAELEQKNKEKQRVVVNGQQVEEAKAQVKLLLMDRCRFFASKMGVTYGTIKVNRAAGRWGSCNSVGTLNFTYRLLFVPRPLLDYIVVHELAHRKEMNHSARFWAVVEQSMPDYRQRRKALRDWERKNEIIETKQ